jgi:arginyl-tRNA synthetase
LPAPGDLALLSHPDELALCHKLSDFPDVVADAAKHREPHRVIFYVQELARDFQSYFTRLKNEQDPILPPRSVSEAEDWRASWNMAKTRARLAWIEAIRITYAQALGVVGIDAPDRMDRPAEDDPMDDAADAADAADDR